MYDEEAIYQDADIEQAEYEYEAARLSALRRSGTCTHDGVVGLSAEGRAFYPEAVGLVGTQVKCTEGCGRVFEDFEEWREAVASL